MRRLLLLSLCGCATLAEGGGGDENLPNAEVGPFREIRQEELGASRPAPYCLRDNDGFERDPTVVDVDDDPATLEAFVYAGRTAVIEGVDPDPAAATNQIVRHVGLDGRSFAFQRDVVLEPAEAWEGDVMGAPSALRADGEVWLYYAAAGGIGLAKSGDGLVFTRVGDGLVLAPVDGWESGATPLSPAVLRLGDGSWRLYYALALAGGSVVAEARSSDGVAWQRGEGPIVLGEAPSSILGISAEDRPIQYLYYGAVEASGDRSIAMAARFGTEGAFVPAAGAVFGSAKLAPTEPFVVRFDGFTLLFVTEKAGLTSALDYPAVAVGVAPANIGLPPPVAE
jgi:hypothetical protein